MDWNAVVTNITTSSGPVWGIIGTLLGALVANANNRRIAQDARAHENRTRFHDQRLAVYSEVLASLVMVRGYKTIGVAQMGQSGVHPRLTFFLLGELKKVLDGAAKVQLIGSSNVRKAAAHVDTILVPFLRDTTAPLEGGPKLEEELTSALNALETAMREDLV